MRTLSLLSLLVVLSGILWWALKATDTLAPSDSSSTSQSENPIEAAEEAKAMIEAGAAVQIPE